jgi:hypothetical protein
LGRALDVLDLAELFDGLFIGLLFYALLDHVYDGFSSHF